MDEAAVNPAGRAVRRTAMIRSMDASAGRAQPPAPDGVVLVAGEALFDLVLDDAGALRAHPGGGPFNTARTLGRLEQPVAYLGRVSADRFGTTLSAMLAADGVRPDAVVPTGDPTTLALAEIDAAGSARYRFYLEGTSAPGLDPQTARAAVPAGVEVVHVGTLGLLLEPMGEALEAVVDALADSALVAVDPNVRPTVVADAAAYRARLERVIARSHVVKVSDEDLAWLDEGRPPVEAARALLGAGPAVVLLTRGGDGVVVLTRAGDEVAVPVPPTRVVDTIGAGDAFGGGFLAWWRARGLSVPELADTDRVVAAARFGCLVAARTCERPGAEPPFLAELGADAP